MESTLTMTTITTTKPRTTLKRTAPLQSSSPISEKSGPRTRSSASTNDTASTKSVKSSAAPSPIKSLFRSKRASTVAKEKPATNDPPSGSTDLPPPNRKRASGRFGFPTSSTAPIDFPKGSTSQRVPSPTSTISSSPRRHGLSSRASPLPASNLKTPSSVRSIAANLFNKESSKQGPMTSPTMPILPDSSVRILDLKAQTDMTSPGDVSFGTTVPDDEEEGNVSMLLPTSRTAPTPAVPKIMFFSGSGQEDDFDDDDEDIDGDNDDNPTVNLQAQTPCKPSQRTRSKVPSLTTRPIPKSKFLSPPPKSSLKPRVVKYSTTSRVRNFSTSKVPSPRARRPSHIHRAARESEIGWEQVLERSKEFSDGDLEEINSLISTDLLGGLGALSPGFATPYRYSIISTASTGTEKSVSRGPTPSGGYPFPSKGKAIAPGTPSPRARTISSARIPKISFTPLKPSPRRVTRQGSTDRLKAQVRAQEEQLTLLKVQMASSQLALESLKHLEEELKTLRTEKDELVEERNEWLSREEEWNSKEVEWGFEKLEMHSVEKREHAKRMWEAVGLEVEREREWLAHQRRVLDVLLGEMDVLEATFDEVRVAELVL